MSESKILKRWSATSNYLGEDFSDFYVVVSFSRDSNVYEIANFIGIARRLSEIEPESERGWKIVRFAHWACGYVYCILVHKDSPLVSLCEEIALSLREYAIYDEDLLSECESLILNEMQESIEDVDTDTQMQMLIEAPAVDYCKTLLAPYL